MLPVCVSVSYLYHMICDITSNITRVLFVPNMTSACVILYNSSVNMIEHNIVFLLSFANKNITYKATAGLLCICEQHRSV